MRLGLFPKNMVIQKVIDIPQYQLQEYVGTMPRLCGILAAAKCTNALVALEYWMVTDVHLELIQIVTLRMSLKFLWEMNFQGQWLQLEAANMAKMRLDEASAGAIYRL